MFKDCRFGQFGTINAWDNLGQYISRYYRVSGDLIGFRNSSKLVQGSLFAIIDLLLRANLSFSTLYGVRGMIFTKKIISEKKIVFFFNSFNFFMLSLLHTP